MEIGDWSATAELNQVFREARSLGLESNIAELEAYGFTIVEPDKISPTGLHARLLEKLVELCEQADREGAEMTGPRTTAADGARGLSYSRFLHLLISRDPVFLEAVMNPVTLTLARYLLGASCRLFTTSAFVKRGPAASTFLHVDSAGNPPPLYPYSVVCNISWILTDYTEENGTFAIVPGSHRYCRHPTPQELPAVMGGPGPDVCIPVCAPAGSLIVFTGNTWHGTYPKKDDALRAHMVTGFCRNYMLPAENYSDVSENLAAPYGEELRRLMGRESWQGYKTEGPKSERIAAVGRAQVTPSA
jgi:ectoine hydroxylase-related dioxygenase (phytanoyl-CoA dioxygenase family)